jgi:hypothetical protein
VPGGSRQERVDLTVWRSPEWRLRPTLAHRAALARGGPCGRAHGANGMLLSGDKEAIAEAAVGRCPAPGRRDCPMTMPSSGGRKQRRCNGL